MKYVVMMIDIKHSKQLTDLERSDYQMKLYDIIKYVNLVFSQSLKEKLTFSGGDSVQGLFKNVKSAVSCFYFIKYAYYPYEIRCGIGYGLINEHIVANKEKYKLNDVNSNFFDGDSYHLALNALNACKKYEYEVLIKSNDLNSDLVINQLIHSSTILEVMMSSKQRDIFDIFNLLSPINPHDELYSLFVSDCLKKNLTEYQLINNELLTSEINQIINNAEMKIDLINKEDLLFIEPFGKFLNEFVAKLIGVTRENIRQMVEKGKYNEIRKTQFIVISSIDKVYVEEIKC